jgi:hypothetical protein
MRTTIAASFATGTLLAALAIGMLTGVAQCQNASGSSFIVDDSAGQIVGFVIGTNQGGGITTVAVLFEGKWLPVAMLRNAFLSGSLYFTSSDCSGQPFGDPSGSPFLASAVDGPNSTLYFEDGKIQHIMAQSTLPGGYICGPAGCTNTCSEASFDLDGVPMSSAKDLNALKPPFRVVAAGGVSAPASPVGSSNH